jgi:ferrochelatase
MAYGSPNSLSEVEPYYRSILGDRAPTPKAVQVLTDRYRRVGGRTPLLQITEDVAAALEASLNGQGASSYRVYVGMKHWHPFIGETVSRMASDGMRRLIALPLAPHYSRMSVGGYRRAVEEAAGALPSPPSVRYIESWHANPHFTAAVVQRIQEALRRFPSGDKADVEVVFSAHSLPTRILQWKDPYPEELMQSCEAVAKSAGLHSWRLVYQSASRTGEPWLGPDMMETLREMAGDGRRQALIVPIGFVSDNLEVLFDIDVEARELAEGLGIKLRRTEMLNASPALIEALADVVANGTGARVVDSPE